MNAVVEYGRPLVEDPARLDGVERLGVDETAFLGANAYHSTSFVTGVVDLTGRVARLLDVVDGRSGKALCDWVSSRTTAWRKQVRVAALDPFRGYATALSTSLPQAVRVLDAFHVTRLGFAAVDDVRRRVQQDSTGTAAANTIAVPDSAVAAPARRPPVRTRLAAATDRPRARRRRPADRPD
jgi:transposase